MRISTKKTLNLLINICTRPTDSTESNYIINICSRFTDNVNNKCLNLNNYVIID